MTPTEINDFLEDRYAISGSTLQLGRSETYSRLEARLHELAHWLVLGKVKPSKEVTRGQGYFILFAVSGDSSSLDGVIEDKMNALPDYHANNQELRAVAVEILALKQLGYWKQIHVSELYSKCYQGLRSGENGGDQRFSLRPLEIDEWDDSHRFWEAVKLVKREIRRLMKTSRVKRLAKKLVEIVSDAAAYSIE